MLEQYQQIVRERLLRGVKTYVISLNENDYNQFLKEVDATKSIFSPPDRSITGGERAVPVYWNSPFNQKIMIVRNQEVFRKYYA